MAGICGVAGNVNGIARISEGLNWSGDERHYIYECDEVAVRCALLPDNNDQPPASTRTANVWIWGDVFGLNGPNGYEKIPSNIPTSQACADLYEQHGPVALGWLNGDFFGVVHDIGQRTVVFVTDRLGSRDVYYSRAPDGKLVFSSRIQSLPNHPEVNPSFDPDYSAEYFLFRRAFGTKTPMEDVFMFPPSSVSTYSLETKKFQSEYYWKPRYEPRNWPFSRFVDEFLKCFRTAVDDRVSGKDNGALLLSGGADSRLLLAVLQELNLNVTTYHMSDWMSREARIAERVALTAGVDFEFLRRGPDYFKDMLEFTPKKNNFVQRFHQAHAQGFIEQLRDEHDYVLTNHMVDVFFKKLVPQHSISLGPHGTITFPIKKRVETLNDFFDYTQLKTGVPFLNTHRTTKDILPDNIKRENEGFNHHGVTYDTFNDLVLYGRIWPGTNGGDTFFRRSLNENITHYVPMLDTRMIDFWLSIPKKYLVRYDIVNAALSRVSSDLGKIPHAGTYVPLTRSFPRNFIESHVIKALRMFPPLSEDPPLPTLNHGPWGNMTDLIRHQDFVEELIYENENVLRRIPFLDFGGALECYQNHLNGKNNTRELLALTTFLKMPITHEIVSESY